MKGGLTGGHYRRRSHNSSSDSESGSDREASSEGEHGAHLHQEKRKHRHANKQRSQRQRQQTHIQRNQTSSQSDSESDSGRENVSRVKKRPMSGILGKRVRRNGRQTNGDSVLYSVESNDVIDSDSDESFHVDGDQGRVTAASLDRLLVSSSGSDYERQPKKAKKHSRQQRQRLIVRTNIPAKRLTAVGAQHKRRATVATGTLASASAASSSASSSSASASVSLSESDDASGSGEMSSADDARTGYEELGSVVEDFYDTRRPGCSGRDGSEPDWWESSAYESDGSYTMSSELSLSGEETEGEFDDVVVVDPELAPRPAQKALDSAGADPTSESVDEANESLTTANDVKDERMGASSADFSIPVRPHHFIHYRHRSEEDRDICADPDHYAWTIEKVLSKRQVPVIPKPGSQTFPQTFEPPVMRDEYLVKWKDRSFLHLDWISLHRLQHDKAGGKKAERIGEHETEYMENVGGYPVSVDRILTSRTSCRVGLWRHQRRKVSRSYVALPVSDSSSSEESVQPGEPVGEHRVKPPREPVMVPRTHIHVHTAVSVRRKPERRFLVKFHLLGYDELSWEWESDLRKQPTFVSALRRYMLWRNDPGCIGVGRVRNTSVPPSDDRADSVEPDAIWMHARQMKCQRRNSHTGKAARCMPIPRQPRAFRPLVGTSINRLIPGNRSLRSYQVEGVNWMLHCWEQGRNVILADEMGLGKTAQTLSLLWQLFQRHHLHGPFLIVAPLSVVAHWKRECEDWTDMNGVLYHGNADARKAIRRYEFVYDADLPKSGRTASRSSFVNRYKFHCLITTYETVVQDFAALKSVPWKFVVVDEAHRLKNPKSKLAQQIRALEYDSFLALTGTPIQNNTLELWALLSFVIPDIVGTNPDQFLEQFGDMKDSSQVEALHELLKPILLRRLKEDVDTSIAAKEETVIEVELTWLQKQYYRAILERNYAFLTKGATGANAPNLANVVMELRKCCNHPYLIRGVEEAAIESGQLRTTAQMNDHLIACCGKLVLIDKLLPKLRAEGHRVLLFSQMVRLLDIVEDFLRYRDYAYERLDGNIRGTARQSAIDRFTGLKNANGRTVAKVEPFVFLLSTRAGGLGINLTAADTVIIFDSDWNPQNDLQAQARAHRIGQTKEVRVYRLITRNTYEQTMFEAASRKLGLDHAVLTLETEQQASVAAASASNVELDDRTIDQLKEGKGVRALSKNVIDQLLKNGVYDLLGDGAEAASKSFCEADVDQILKRSTTTRHDGGESRGLHAFSKASFTVGSDTAAEIDVHDPDFWNKLLPAASSATAGMDASAVDESFESRRQLLDGSSGMQPVDSEVLKAGRKERAQRKFELERAKGSDHDDDDDDFAPLDASMSDESISDAEPGSDEAARRVRTKPVENSWTVYERSRLLRSFVDAGFGRPQVTGMRAHLIRPDISVYTIAVHAGYPALPQDFDPFRLPTVVPSHRGKLYRQSVASTRLFSIAYLRKMLQCADVIPRPRASDQSKIQDTSESICPALLADFVAAVAELDRAFLASKNLVFDASHAVWVSPKAPSAAYGKDTSLDGEKMRASLRNTARSHLLYLDFLARARLWASFCRMRTAQIVVDAMASASHTLHGMLARANMQVRPEVIYEGLRVDVLDTDLDNEITNLQTQQARLVELRRASDTCDAADVPLQTALQTAVVIHTSLILPFCESRVSLVRTARKLLLDDLSGFVREGAWTVHDKKRRGAESAFAVRGRALAPWWEPRHDAGLILAVLWHPHPFMQNNVGAQSSTALSLLAGVELDESLPFLHTKASLSRTPAQGTTQPGPVTSDNDATTRSSTTDVPYAATGNDPAEDNRAMDGHPSSNAFVMPPGHELLKRVRDLLKQLEAYRVKQARSEERHARRAQKRASRNKSSTEDDGRSKKDSHSSAVHKETSAHIPIVDLDASEEAKPAGEAIRAAHTRQPSVSQSTSFFASSPPGAEIFKRVHSNLTAHSASLPFLSRSRPKQAFDPAPVLARQREWHLLLLRHCVQQFQSYDDFSVVGDWSADERARLMDTLVSFGLPQLSDGEVFARDAHDISAVDWKAFRCRSLLAARQSSDCRKHLEAVLRLPDANISYRLNLFWELRTRCLPAVIRWAISHGLGGLPSIVGGVLGDARSVEHACSLAGQTGLFLGPDATSTLIARLEQLMQSHLLVASKTTTELLAALDRVGFPSWWQSPHHDAALLVGISKYGFVCSPSRFARGLDFRSVALAATVAVREHQVPANPSEDVKLLNLLPSERPIDQYGRGGWADILADSSLPFVSIFNAFHSDLRRTAGTAAAVTVVDVITRMQLPDEHVIGSRIRRLARIIVSLVESEKDAPPPSVHTLSSNLGREVSPPVLEPIKPEPSLGHSNGYSPGSMESTSARCVGVRCGRLFDGIRCDGSADADDLCGSCGRPIVPDNDPTLQLGTVIPSMLSTVPRYNNGQVIWPLQLRRDLLVAELGTVSSFESFHTPTHIFPLGYKSLRHMPACLTEAYERCIATGSSLANASQWYVMEVAASPDMICMFTITPAPLARTDVSVPLSSTSLHLRNLEAQPVLGYDPNKVWQMMMQRVASVRMRISAQLKGMPGGDLLLKTLPVLPDAGSLNGLAMFGLDDPVVQELIQKLPNSNTCTRYVMKQFISYDDAGGINGSSGGMPLRREGSAQESGGSATGSVIILD